jgi:hypothetical protein
MDENMPKFFFSSLDILLRTLFRHPRVIGLFWIFFFSGSTVCIGFWEAPEKVSQPVPVADVLPCAWRLDRALNDSFDQSPHRAEVSDLCGEEARAWSRRLALMSDAESLKRGVPSDAALDSEIASLTAGYPIEQMAASIARYDRPVAALLVGIAKKESNWGRRVPRSDDGEDCYNYWGFKGAGSRGIAMGHGCFGSAQEAVEKVGDRIAELVDSRSTSEPRNFTIWKCGSSCATHSPESVRKWVSDVDQYYRLLASR